MTEALKTELVNFKELASVECSGRREELARHVATLFALTSDRCSDEQVEIYDSVLLRLVDMVETEVRKHVAEQLATLQRGPGQTLRRLAEDDIEIAEPVLINSCVLSEDDLIRIANMKDAPHLIAIAQREVLSVDLTDVLVNRGDLHVRLKVAGNDGAMLSPASFTKLVGDAASDADMQMTLSERCDLTDKHIRELVVVVGEDVRQKLKARGRREEAERLSEATTIAAQRVSNQYWLSPYDFDEAQRCVDQLAKRGMVTEAVLRRFAAENRFAEAVAAFAWMVHCGVEEVSHWMVRTDPEPFLIIAKAFGLSSGTVRALLSVGPWEHRLTLQTRRDAIYTFEKLTVTEAKRRVAHWLNIILN